MTYFMAIKLLSELSLSTDILKPEYIDALHLAIDALHQKREEILKEA